MRRGGLLVGLLGVLGALVVLLGATGCASPTVTAGGSGGTRLDGGLATTTSTASAPTTTTVPTTAPVVTPPGQPFDPRVVLEPLLIDDRPRPDRPYRRAEWPHWDDIDRNGCDGREDALIRASTVPVNRGDGCRVLAGEWVSPYDGLVTTDPGAIQIDHLVPLENAFVSGGWRWDVGRRRLFANDQAELVATSASSNQSKGSKTPDEWRPRATSVWCAYALTWVRVKVTYDLTATTAERDALGRMLETCPADVPADARPGGPGGTPSATSAAPTFADSGGEVFYANCASARAAGAAPVLAGQPGYRARLDGDGDGVACE